jgi:hypothetical protein
VFQKRRGNGNHSIYEIATWMKGSNGGEHTNSLHWTISTKAQRELYLKELELALELQTTARL